MKKFKLIFLLLCLAVSFSCNKDQNKPLQIQIISTPKPIPAIKLDYMVIEGNAFIDLQGEKGSDDLSGLKIQLIDGTLFEKKFESTQKNILCRWISANVFDTDCKISNDNQSIARFHNIQNMKKKELDECLKVGWSEFTYTDPFTQKKYKGDFKDTVTVPFMKRRLNDLQNQINILQNSIKSLNMKRTENLKLMTTVNPNYQSVEDCEAFYINNMELFSRNGNLSKMEFKNSAEIIQEIDNATLDNEYADKSGNFRFRVKDNKKYYLCYSSYRNKKKSSESYSWLVPVIWDDNLISFRKIVLSDKNSIDYEKWNKALRQDNMNTSMRRWLVSFDR